jgi:hypothetical protein
MVHADLAEFVPASVPWSDVPAEFRSSSRVRQVAGPSRLFSHVETRMTKSRFTEEQIAYVLDQAQELLKLTRSSPGKVRFVATMPRTGSGPNADFPLTTLSSRSRFPKAAVNK